MSARADKRRAKAAAAKDRRRKILAIGLLGVFAALLVIQGPKLQDAVRGSDSSAATAPPAPVPTVPSTEPRKKEGKALLFKASNADPFASRSLANNDPRAGDLAGPAGAKDPFAGGGSGTSGSGSSPAPAPQPVAQPLPNKIVIGTPTVNGKAKRGWIVVIASIQTRLGRGYANRFATGVRLRGLTPVAVLDSSTRKPLRSGYYVVYTGPFATLSDVQRSAAHVHAFGYRTAYVREILQY